jgi:ribonucleoside-diphosphate reductase alpha chain
MISAVFRRGGDVSFVVDELKAVFDPRGGHWMNGKYVPSLLAAIGEVIENHMIKIGFIHRPGSEIEESEMPDAKVVNLGEGGESAARMRQCRRCGQAGLVRLENCDTCMNCGYSKCS